jgi:4-amino-4-deoxy-L-arabinose transferase-like glycosyltransferase
MRSAPPLGRAVVVALVLLAAAAVLRGVAWAAALPAWQGPDEPAHYAYVERLSTGDFPPLQTGEARDSAALRTSLVASAYWRFRFREPTRPLSAELQARTLQEQPGLPTEGRAARGATIYPPLYYALALPAYALPALETATARLYAVRAVSALLAGVLVVATFLLVLEATGRPRLALAGGMLVTLPPIVGQGSGIANPDMLLAAGVAGLAWAALRFRRRPRSIAAAAHVAAWLAVVALSKPIGTPVATIVLASLLVVPAVAESRRLAALATGAAGTLGAAATVLVAAAGERLQSPLAYTGSYLLEFYRPRLPRLTDETAVSPAWTVWVESGVGGFGWLTIWLPQWTYGLALASAVVAAVLAAAGLARDRSPLRFPAWAALAVVVYVVVLHAIEVYGLLHGGERVLQGRYLIAIAPLASATFCAGLAALPPRVAAAAVAMTTAVWGFLALAGLDATVRFFAT